MRAQLAWRRVGFVAALVALAVAIGGAGRAESAPRIERQAWAATGPLGPPSSAEQRIYVSAALGQEQARAFLGVDVVGVDADRVAGATVKLVETSESVLPDRAALAACALTEPLDRDGDVSQSPPAADCTSRAPLTRQADGTWTLPLAVFASRVADDGIGLAVFPDLTFEQNTYFSLAFDTAMTTVEAPAPGVPPTTTTTTTTQPDPGAASDDEEEIAADEPAEAGATLPIPVAGPPIDDVPAPVPPASAEPVAAAGPTSTRGAVRPISAVVAASPPAVLVLLPTGLAGLLAARRRRRSTTGTAARTVPASTVANWGAAAALVTAVVALFDEVNAYRLGFVAIVFVAAIGLHILVNWAGELSLAHAGMIGLPAFLVAQLATHTGVSTILLLPAGVVIGAALGLLIAIPARRARGLHVALVTLAVAIAVEQFFFNRSWVIGPPSGLSVGHPELFGVEFRTNRSLLPVLAAVVVIAVVAGRSLLASTVGRALAFMRANPDAAAAAGIPVASYRSAVYGVAGAFAGLAGAMYVMWVQHVTPQAFPLNLSFTYLVLAVLAGNGGLSGVAFSALALEGGRLFLDLGGLLAYLGPIALIVNVTKYEEGLNGALRISREHTAALVRSLAHRRGRPMTGMTEATGARRARVPVVLATMAIVAGFASIALAWYHMGNTSQTWVQNQEFVSGGIGGLGLIIVGCTILITDALLRAREEPDAVAGPMVVAEGTVVRSAAEGGRRRRTPTAAEAR